MDIAQLIPVIDILEGLETLMDKAPSGEIEGILQSAWLQVSETFPKDFLAATHDDASAAGLRRYLRVKAFFEDPIKDPIQSQDLADYYQNRQPIDEEKAEFFFLDANDEPNT